MTYPVFSNWLFYFMLLHLFLLIVLSAANFEYLRQEMRKIPGKAWIALALIFLFGWYLRNSEFWLGPHTDGYVAQESARMWMLNGQYLKSCAVGNPGDCAMPEQVLAPPGYPFLIVISHLIFGMNSLNASVISAQLSSLVILLVFSIAYLLWKRYEAGLYAALIYATIPINIINSQSGESRPTGLFFSTLTMLFFVLAARTRKFHTWLACAVALSYAVYVRQESFILVPLLAVFSVSIFWQDIRKYIKDGGSAVTHRLIWRISLLSGVFVFLQMPFWKWIFLNNPYSHQNAGLLPMYLQGWFLQASSMLRQFFNLMGGGQDVSLHQYNVEISLFFLIGMFMIIKKIKNDLVLAGFFLAYFAVYSLMFDGGLQGTGTFTIDYIRRSVMLNSAYSLIAAWPIYRIGRYFFKYKYLIAKLALLFMVIILTSPLSLASAAARDGANNDAGIGFYFPSSLFRDARADKKGDQSLVYPDSSYWRALRSTGNGCLIISRNYLLATNDYFPQNQRKTISLDIIFPDTKEIITNEMKKSPCVEYIEDYKCPDDPADDPRCGFIRDNLDLVLKYEYNGVKVYRAFLKPI